MLPYYYSLNEFLQKEYGHKLYKLALNGGMTCPNRDGLIDTKGCIFCSAGGSGDFAGGRKSDMDINTQIDNAKALIKNKYNGGHFIAYFQSFTNTYADIDYLRNLYMPVIRRDDIDILSIATRPDCIDDKVLDLLAELSLIKPVWVELGLQTTNENTARYIRRGYPLKTFDECVSTLRSIGIRPIVHMIAGLPNENMTDMLNISNNAVGSGFYVFQACSQVQTYKGCVVFASEPFAKAWCEVAFVFKQVVHIFGLYIGTKVNPR